MGTVSAHVRFPPNVFDLWSRGYGLLNHGKKRGFVPHNMNEQRLMEAMGFRCALDKCMDSGCEKVKFPGSSYETSSRHVASRSCSADTTFDRFGIRTASMYRQRSTAHIADE